MISSAALVLALVPATPFPTPRAEAAGIGEPVPDLALEGLVGGDGRTRLAEFVGTPVLLVDWADFASGYDAVRVAVALQEDLGGDGVAAILHETQGMEAGPMQALLLERFPGHGCRLITRRWLPIRYEDNGPPPRVAVIGVDGQVAVAGSYLADLARARKRIEEEHRRRKSGWGDHPAARKARARAFGRDELAEARELVARALAEEPDAAELATAAAEVERAYASRLRAVDFHLEAGDARRALETAQALAKAVRGDAAWEQEVAALLERFESDEVERELKLAKQLDKLERGVHARGPRPGQAEDLRRFAESAPGTRVAARAVRLAALVEAAVD